MKFLKYLISKIAAFFAQRLYFIVFPAEGKPTGCKVLVSYIVNPYIGYNSWHPNSEEVRSIVKCFRSLGYRVYLCDYRNVVLGLYDFSLCFGFGRLISNYASKNGSKVIYYTTGLPSHIQNQNALYRLKEFRAKARGFSLDEIGINNIRLAESDATLVGSSSFIFGVGDSNTSKYYSEVSSAKVSHIPAIIDLSKPSFDYIPEHTTDLVNILWLGGKGAVHKGLDLLLDVLSRNKDFHLHIAGPILDEDILRVFNESGNINYTYYGLVEPKKVDFSFCDFVVLPSCSEGMATSVLTAIWLYGTYPIVSKWSGFEGLPHRTLVDLVSGDIERAIYKAMDNRSGLNYKTSENRAWVEVNCNQQSYYSSLKEFLSENII